MSGAEEAPTKPRISTSIKDIQGVFLNRSAGNGGGDAPVSSRANFVGGRLRQQHLPRDDGNKSECPSLL